LPAHGNDVVRYQVPEPPSGVSEQRLMAFVDEYVFVSRQQHLELIAHPGRVTRMWISPDELRLNVGQSGRLTAHGQLFNGSLALGADLTAVAWTTTNPAVLVVKQSGRVLGVSPGKTLVWVQIGAARARAIVVVSGLSPGDAPPAAANQSQPPTQSSTSPQPSSSGPPTPTSPPPTSASLAPTSPPPTSGSPTPAPSGT
jgi:hypothetical protein